VLLNVGYVTNPSDVRYLEDAAWRKAFAVRVVGAIAKFREVNVHSAAMHDKMGVPEQMTHIWQMDRKTERPTYKFDKNGELELQDGC
jgi:hypothetical protein